MECSKKVRIKYVVEDTDGHGNVRVYLRKNGRKVRLRGPLGSPEFWREYHAALKPPPKVRGEKKTIPGTIQKGTMRWLVAQYTASGMFKQLGAKTQKDRRATLERFCNNVPKGSTAPDGEKPFDQLQAKHIRLRRDALVATPEAANTILKAIKQMFKFAVQYEHLDRNPAADVEPLKSKGDGYHSWTLEEIEKFESVHPVGTTARLALALALYTSQRRSDLVKFGKQHVQDGWLVFTQFKGRADKPVRLELPIIPELQRIIDASPTGDLAFLATAYGKPFTAAGFGNRMREWCDKAKLSDCSTHGLRKAAAARLAELGCTEFEIMAITGHQTSKEVTRYTKAASQRLRAESALAKLTGTRS
ncbi:MAG: tyrosine recombinase XerC [Roseinatronobacter sp.]